MDRRRAMRALGALAMSGPGAAITSLAQRPSGRIYRIGFLGTAFASGYVRELEWIRAGLRELGYVEGQNLTIEYRWAEGSPERLRAMAAELVALKVDLILTHALPGALAAARETSAIPIVMADGIDPVGAGLADSVARPGRNVTGSFSFIAEEVGKRLQLLLETVPAARRVAFLASTVDGFIGLKRAAMEEAAAAAKVHVQEFQVRDAADLPAAFNAMSDARMEAAVINNEPLLNSVTATIAGLAAVKRLPAIGYASFADAGGLLAYGANRPALYRRSAYFVDRIFSGTRPGDIPLERAAKFDLIVNLRTARSIGVTVPLSVRLSADRIIE